MRLKHVMNIVHWTFHYLFWRWKFLNFGWRSQLQRCDRLHGTKAISIGKDVLIRKGARLEAVGKWDGTAPKIVIGNGTVIQFYFHCGAAESVKIGKDVLIAGRVYITDHDHAYDHPQLPPIRRRELVICPVVIEDGAFLGEGCVILKGVTVGKRAVVGANSVVTKDVPPYSVAAGVPARVIRKISPSKMEEN